MQGPGDLALEAESTRDGEISPETGSARIDRYAQTKPRSVIGTRVPRKDALEKVTGAAKYSCDIQLPGMLFAIAVRSPHASALVLDVETGDAGALPGVKGILTYVGKRIRYAGDEVAVVAAETLYQARDAARAIQVSYEVYPFVVTADAALEADAPRVYDDRPNAGNPRVSTKGSVDQGFTEAAAIFEGEFHTQVQTHCPMETHGAVAHWLDDLHLDVYISTQGTFSSRSDFASHFQVPTEYVRVYCEHIGGGFGSKIGTGTYGIMAAELARMTGRPVRLVLDRKEEQLATGNRPDSVQFLRIGARADGTLSAIELTGYGTAGVGSGAGFGLPARSQYEVSSYYTEEMQVYTHCGPAAAMRAPGHPQGVFPLEVGLDALAYQLGMDPIALRLANDRFPLRRKQFSDGATRFGWSARNPLPGADTGILKRGMGVASCTWTNGGQPGCEVWCTLFEDGWVLVENGAQDIGTGTRTWMAMLVAEELGLSPERVDVRMGDTALPYGPLSGGSTVTPSLSPPTRQAGQNARAALAERVAPALGTTPDQLVFADGNITAPSGASMTFTQACATIDGQLRLTGTRTDDMKVGADTVTGVHFAEVEVDTRIGKIRVLRLLAVHNGGRILNLLTAESQVLGGVIQGMNYALFEERIMETNLGIMMNANLESYKIGGSKDMPDIDLLIQDLSSGGTSVGAVGIGESPIIPTAAAIANAVYHALGVRLTALPMTPARVLEALGTVGNGAKARSQRKGERR